MIEPASAAIGVAIAELPAVGQVWVIAVNQAVPMPIRSPAVPPPAEAIEETDTNSHAELDPRSIEVEAWNLKPIGVDSEGIAVNDPGIVFRYVNDLRIRWFNYDRVSVGRDGFLL